LLPVPYFHVVFTLPEQLNPLALANQKVLFDILFATAAATLREIAADERHLGADIGFTAVLHTWGQNLMFHPHLHCVVTRRTAANGRQQPTTIALSSTATMVIACAPRSPCMI
jgi:hypothetical protein